MGRFEEASKNAQTALNAGKKKGAATGRRAPMRKKKEPKNQHLHLLTTESIYNELAEAAEDDLTSMNALANLYIKEGLERRKKGGRK